jgi:hypothetical protein
MFNLKSKSMRKLSLGLLTLAMAAVVFTSCKKDENAAPVVSFTNIADSISTIEVTADSYDLTVQVTSEAGLKEVKISETKNGTTTDKETISTFENNADFTKVYKVSGIPTSGMDVTISATDKDDQNTTRKISLKKKETTPTPTALTVVTFKAVNQSKNTDNLVGAGGHPDFGSYVDLDGGKIYLSADAKGATYKSTIDVIFDQSSFFNNDATSTAPGFAAGTGTNLKVVTGVDYATANSASLTGLSVTSSDKEAVVATGTVIYFETATNKGLLKVNNLTVVTGDKNTVSIEAKIMAK